MAYLNLNHDGWIFQYLLIFFSFEITEKNDTNQSSQLKVGG